MDGSKTILVVEDNPSNMFLLRALLTASGYEMLEAETAESGIALARQALPDLILMDVSLPEMDGLDATRVLKSDPGTCRIPVIAVTAHAMPEDRRRALAAGCAEHITKPIDTRALPGIIERAITEAGTTACRA